MSDIYKKTDLDALHMLVRKGNLELLPRNLMIKFRLNTDDTEDRSCSIELFHTRLFKDDSPEDWSGSTYWAQEHKKERVRLKKAIKNQSKFKAQVRYFEISIHKYKPVTSSTVRLVYPDRRNWQGEYEEKSFPLKVRSGLTKALFTPKESKELRNDSKTILEWYRWCRVIRNRLRRLLLDGKLNGTLNRCDQLKSLKGHDTVLSRVISEVSKLSDLIQPIKDVARNLHDELNPYVQVEPYHGIRVELDCLDTALERITEAENCIRVRAGMPKREETYEQSKQQEGPGHAPDVHEEGEAGGEPEVVTDTCTSDSGSTEPVV